MRNSQLIYIFDTYEEIRQEMILKKKKQNEDNQFL
jgi:hypothetical protein